MGTLLLTLSLILIKILKYYISLSFFRKVKSTFSTFLIFLLLHKQITNINICFETFAKREFIIASVHNFYIFTFTFGLLILFGIKRHLENQFIFSTMGSESELAAIKA